MQVDYALELIDELHPLENTPLHKVYPALKYLCCCCVCVPTISGGKTADIEEPLIEQKHEEYIHLADGRTVKKKSKRQRKKPADRQYDDPLEQLGFGIVAYNEMLRKFIWLFAFFSILMAPVIYYFQNGSGYQFSPKALQGYEMRTLGNMGYSSVQCRSMPLAVEKMVYGCPYGSVGEIYDYGVNLVNDGGARDSCIETDQNRACKPDNPSVSRLLNDSLGKASTSYDVTGADLYTDLVAHANCVKEENLPTLFVQYSCI